MDQLRQIREPGSRNTARTPRIQPEPQEPVALRDCSGCWEEHIQGGYCPKRWPPLGPASVQGPSARDVSSRPCSSWPRARWTWMPLAWFARGLRAAGPGSAPTPSPPPPPGPAAPADEGSGSSSPGARGGPGDSCGCLPDGQTSPVLATRLHPRLRFAACPGAHAQGGRDGADASVGHHRVHNLLRPRCARVTQDRS